MISTSETWYLPRYRVSAGAIADRAADVVPGVGRYLMAEAGLPDFSGKVVFVHLPREGFHWVLVEAKFERQGDRWVIVGEPCYDREYHGDNDWARGARVGIPWKHVAYYVVYDSIEEFKARLPEQPTPADEAEAPRRSWIGRRRDS
jgi:hypothetical protein